MEDEEEEFIEEDIYQVPGKEFQAMMANTNSLLQEVISGYLVVWMKFMALELALGVNLLPRWECELALRAFGYGLEVQDEIMQFMATD